MLDPLEGASAKEAKDQCPGTCIVDYDFWHPCFEKGNMLL